ncbi:MAG TPA: tetratricopeptide repeat protein [Candidatus Binatus sp.]|nr:tetratricopeptide repeat protein [Candidatus Binatus sp.]
MSDDQAAVAGGMIMQSSGSSQTAGADHVKPYIIKTYDRWIILVLVLVAGWFLFKPIFAFSVYYRGVSFEHMLRLKTAEHYYRKAISVDPHIPEGWVGLGTLQAMSAKDNHADYLSAIDTFTRGLENNPTSGALPWGLCRAYYEIGADYPNALTACQRAFTNDPKNLFAWDYAAWASIHMGKRDQALAYWRQALKLGHVGAAAFIKKYSK